MSSAPGEGRPSSRVSPLAALVGPLAVCLAGLPGVAGCSIVLDFDPLPDAAPIDAPVTEAQCMAFEPNDDTGSAVAIDPGELMAAVCASGESDYFKLTVAANQQLSVKIAFDNRGGGGDLDLRLLSGDGAVGYDDSRTTNDIEEVMCPGGSQCPITPLPAGTYLVQVFGARPTVQAAYTLTYTKTAR
jgi:hypothetical protein